MKRWTREDQQLRNSMMEKRRELGLSLREVGALLGMSFSTLGRFERQEGILGTRSRSLVQTWLDNKEWQEIPRKTITLSSTMHAEILRLVDARIQEWLDTAPPPPKKGA